MTVDQAHDELLVLRSQDGDVGALDELVGRWQERFLRTAFRLTGEREAARDAVQEAWLAIVRGLGRLDDPARFGPWAFRIVRNKAIDWVRRRGRRRQRDRELAAERERHVELGGRKDSTERGRRLADALALLPREQQALLALFYEEGFRIGEIAEILEVPAGTVKSRLYRARNQLKQAIEGERDE
ncbi:MAG: sigma-70 family RNA polymerase sigma factor [Thermoanaerobaculia bacterium]|nr:sigma-70 family RNA polymerase sigma factor [Thermoanaerobaculia bacterium]